MATAQTKPPENAILSEEAQLAQKYGGAIKKPGMNNILQKRLNKGQKYFDSGDYNMAKAKTPGVPKAAQPSTQSGISASAEQPQAEESQPPPTAEPTAATEVDVQQASTVSGPAESVPPAETNVEAAAKTDSTDEQQRSYPRKAVPAASPLTKPPTPSASGVPAPDGAPVGGIPHPRALTVHLAHPTHTGPFVTHPERSSPSAETPPVAVGADGERRTSASHSHDVQAEQI